jgi:chloride channel 7
MLNHLLSRHEEDEPIISRTTLFATLPLYFVLASVSFGLQVPAGNFVPGIAIGATLGRIVGMTLAANGLIGEWQPGAYALLGAAAVLSGMTRMTLTLAAILVEVADDIRLMPAIMLTLSVANVVAEKLAHGFDEAMMTLQVILALTTLARTRTRTLSTRRWRRCRSPRHHPWDPTTRRRVTLDDMSPR